MTTLELEDRVALQELTEAYFEAVDRGDGDDLAALFTENGTLTMIRPEGDEGPVGLRRGREEIAAQTNWLADQYFLTAHIHASRAVQERDGEVIGQVRCVAHHVSIGNGELTNRVVYLRYHDVYAREDARWRFASRELQMELTASYSLEATYPVSG